jgi:hypothetical protein
MPNRPSDKAEICFRPAAQPLEAVTLEALAAEMGISVLQLKREVPYMVLAGMLQIIFDWRGPTYVRLFNIAIERAGLVAESEDAKTRH